jgi:hypothetical protein
MNLSRQKFFNVDYSGKDLRAVDMSGSSFVCCNFDMADMTGVDASNSKFVGGTMRRTKCTRTNFMNTQLALRYDPSDCLGMTLTLSCSTFKGMSISEMWWYGWLYFAYQMVATPFVGRDSKQVMREFIGEERFSKLDAMFNNRQL